MGAIASQITSLAIVYSTVYSGADQRKHQSSASLAFAWGIHQWPVNSPHKWSVTRKMFPFDDVPTQQRYTLRVLLCCYWVVHFGIQADDTSSVIRYHSIRKLHNTRRAMLILQGRGHICFKQFQPFTCYFFYKKHKNVANKIYKYLITGILHVLTTHMATHTRTSISLFCIQCFKLTHQMHLVNSKRPGEYARKTPISAYNLCTFRYQLAEP